MLKRMFSLFLCLVLLVSAVPVNVFAEGADGGDISVDDLLPEVTDPTTETDPTETEPPSEPELPVSGSCGDGVWWEFDRESGHLRIYGQGAMYDFDPAPWYDHRDAIRMAEVAEGIVYIGAFAFQDCGSLTEISLPESVQAIDYSAFDGSYGPTFLVKPDSYADIFAQELGFPTEYPEEPVPPTEPTDPSEPEDLIAQGEAGKLSWKLTTDGVLVIIGDARMDYYSDENPAPWTQYADRITQVKFQGAPYMIQSNTFRDLKITEITIPEGTEYMTYQVFNNCDLLETVSLPSGLAWMTNMFHSCDALQNIYIAQGNPFLYDEDGVALYSRDDQTTLQQYPTGRADAKYAVSQGVHSIGKAAFQFADQLQGVALPQSLESIQEKAFAESGLKSIIIPENVTYIGYYAFENCTDLKELTFQGDLVGIESSAFTGVNATAYYPADNDTWTESAMQNYGGKIKWVPTGGPVEDLIASGETGDLTWKITKDGMLVFEGEGWPDFYFEDKPAPWKAYADQILGVVLPGTVKSLSFRLFDGLNNLTQVTVPEGVEILGYEAFYNCEKLETVYLPSTIKHVDAPFISCDSLKNIYVAEGNPNLSDDNGIAMLTQDGKRNLFVYPIGRPEQAYAVAEGVERIAGYAFYDAKLKEVTLPQSLTEIGEHAFEESDLEAVTIPEKVTYISYFAFADCGSLKTIEFTGDLMAIGADAFTNVTADAYYPADNETWTQEARAQFGAGLKWIPREPAVSGQCGEKVSWSFDKETGTLTVSGTGAMVDDMSEECPWSYWRSQVKHLVIEKGITTLSHHAFKQMPGLTEVNLPDTVEFIGEATFGTCTGLTELVIPEGVKGIATSAFAQCTGLTRVTFPASLEVVGGCFYDCTALTEVVFLGDAPDINFELFCDLTVTAYYPADNATWTEDKLQNYGGNVTWVKAETPDVEIIAEGEAGSLTWRLTADGLLEIMGSGWMDFYYEDNPAPWTMYAAQVTKLKISEDIMFLSGMAFRDLRITEVTIPEGVEYVQPETFYNCDLLKTVHYPSTALGMHAAFYSCDSLENIYVAPGSQWLYDEDGVGLRKWEDILTLCQYPIGRSDESYAVPQGVTHIGQGAFQEADDLKTVKLPQSLNMIDILAFAESGLETITIPGNVTFISYLAFRNCDDLQELTFRGDLVEIAEDAFKGVKANAYYPKDNKTWTKSALKNYGGRITWIAMEALPCDHANVSYAEGKAPTCYEEGLLEHWICTDCGQLWLDEALTQKTDSVVLPITHALVHVPYLASTDTTDGNEEYWHCDLCGKLWLDEGLTLEAEPQDVVIPAGTEVIIRPLTLIPVTDLPEIVKNSDGSYIVYLDKEAVEAEGLLFSVQAKARNDEGKEIALNSKDLKWSTSDSRIAAVKADGALPMGHVTLKAKAEGACVITAVNTKTKDEAALTIHVRDYSPRLGATSLSLNAYSWQGAVTDLVASYGNTITSVSLHNAQGKGYAEAPSEVFVPAYDNGENLLVITTNAIVKKGTHKLLLKVGCDNGETYEYKLTLKVTQTLPTVTVKQLDKFNTFYTDSIAQFQITSKGGSQIWAEIDDNPALTGEYDSDSGILTVRYSDAFLDGEAKLKNKLTIRVSYEDYRLDVEKSVSLKTVKKAPKLALSQNAATVNTALTDVYLAAFAVYEPDTGDSIPGEYLRAEASFADIEVGEDGIALVYLHKKQGGTVNVFVQKENWAEPVKLTFKVNLKTAMPKLEIGEKAFTLNTHFTDTVVWQSMWIDQHNVILEDYELMIYGKNQEVLDEGSKLLFEFYDSEIYMKLDPENLPKPGTYEYRIYGYVWDGINGGYKELAPKSFKVTVEDKLPTVKLKNANLRLNKQLSTGAWAETAVQLPKGYESYAVVDMISDGANGDFGTSFDPETGLLRVELLKDSARNASIALHPVLEYLPTGECVELSSTVTLKVNVFSGNPSVTLAAKGKLDAIDPNSAIDYTIRKLTNIAGTPESVYLRGADGELFDVELLSDGTARLTLARGAAVKKNGTYKPELVYVIDGQEVAAKISVKVSQSSMKVAAPKSLNLYQSNSRLGFVLEVTAPEGASIDSIALSSKSAKQLLSAVGGADALKFVERPDGSVVVTVKVQNPGYLTWGKSYNLYLDVTPEGNTENTKPVSVKVTVKTFK